MKRLILAFMLLAAPAGAALKYVAVGGINSGSCTFAAPCSISRALSTANPGDTIYFMPGTYQQATPDSNAGIVMSVTRAGTAAQPIVWKSYAKWQAKIYGRDDATQLGVKITANYNIIEDFDIYGFRFGGVYVASGGSNTTIRGNRIHHTARTMCIPQTAIPRQTEGRDGIFAWQSNNVLIENNVIHDIGRLQAGEGGCSFLPAPWTAGDHGVYWHDGSGMTIRNNVFYNISAGWHIQMYPGPCTGGDVYGNTFLGALRTTAQAGQIVIQGSTMQCSIRNNISIRPRAHFIKASGASGLTGVFSNNVCDTLSAFFNTTPTGATVSNYWPGVNPRTVGSATSQYTMTGNGVVTATTAWLYENPPWPNLSLLNFSPCLDFGLAISGWTQDLVGNLRPFCNNPDVGAFEYQGCPCDTPPGGGPALSDSGQNTDPDVLSDPPPDP